MSIADKASDYTKYPEKAHFLIFILNLIKRNNSCYEAIKQWNKCTSIGGCKIMRNLPEDCSPSMFSECHRGGPFDQHSVFVARYVKGSKNYQ